MRRFKWRIAAILSGLALVVPALLIDATPTIAIGSGTMTWTGGYWKDPVCGTSNAIFDVRLFRHTQYEGTMWRFCSNYNNLCHSPWGQDSSDALACELGVNANDTANDKASSLKVIDVKGGSNCRVRIHEHAGYSGFAITEWDWATYPSLVGLVNDQLSSLRRVC
jgi:hypothetical protein